MIFQIFENMVSDPTEPLILLGFAGSDPNFITCSFGADDLERRLCAPDMRSALRRVPDLSLVPRDGRVVNADRGALRPLRYARALDLRSARLPFELRSSAHFPSVRRIKKLETN
jgi:hypothetical protein